MDDKDNKIIEKAKNAALEVLLNNMHGPFRQLPRTAAWGYPEPYTRDLLICLLGVLTSGNDKLISTYKKVLETLAKNQSPHGHIPSLVHDPQDRGSSDCTPLFLMAAAIFRKFIKDDSFLEDAVEKSLTWMQYQSPSDRVIVAQLPTSDWRDEQWVMGYGLYVNTIVYSYLKLLNRDKDAQTVKDELEHFAINEEKQHRHVHEGLLISKKPYYALWSYKIYRSERFDLLGNSIAILSGLASPTRAEKMVHWIEEECGELIKNNLLFDNLPPNFFPYIKPSDPDWLPRYEKYNKPGEYHNGGIWPFICGFYVAALVAAGRQKTAEKNLLALTSLVKQSRDADLEFGFNEWHKAQDGVPKGQNWQSWSAAMYLYAANCVQLKKTPFFEEIREK